MFQVVGLLFILFGIIGKIGAVFVTIPYPVVGGMMMINFGVLVGVVLSNLQFIDLESTRNLGIIGMSMLVSFMFPHWIETTPNAIDTGMSTIYDWNFISTRRVLFCFIVQTKFFCNQSFFSYICTQKLWHCYSCCSA